MKKTITCAVVAVYILCVDQAYSQSVSFSPNEYFISFKSGTTFQQIDAIKSDLNSSEIWSDNSLGLQLWRVNGFPFITSEGDTITNINENVVVSEEKTEVDHVGYNYSSHVNPLDEASPACNQQSFPVYTMQGESHVKISILVTTTKN